MGSSQKYILGLDLGSASIGWAVILLDQNDEPCKLQAAGAHIFDPGVEKPPAVGQMSQDELILRGLDRSKAAGRRIARQQRRQIDRRSLRAKKLFKLLQSNKLLPNCNDPDYTDLNSMTLADERFHLFMRLDKMLSDNLAKAHRKRGKGESVMLEADQALPYVLRKEALERKLTPWELGRALYHLCQRRGYRAGQANEDEEEEAVTDVAAAKKSRTKKVSLSEVNEDEKEKANPKQVEAGILDLKAKMDAVHAPTYGAYFANFTNNDPHQERIRKRWTSRDKYLEEFNLIWDTQRAYYQNADLDAPELLHDDLRKLVKECLFYQRPLASAAHLIGRCELIPEARRAPWATLEAQRFRLLQKVGDLAYLRPGEKHEERLNPEQRKLLAEALETRGDMTFKQIAELLSLPPETYFNLPRGKKEQKEKKILGNRINHLMLKIFGNRWTNELTTDQRHKAVNSWVTLDDREARIAKAKFQWGLDETVDIWADEKPPKDYCKFSLAALRELNAGMERGIHWTTTAAELRSRLAPKEPMKFVPPVKKALPAITNPAVLRALTELRKVVNAIVRQYDHPPYEIRIELARELRKNRKQRHDAHEANEKNHERRMVAARKILDECKNYEHRTVSAENLVRYHRDDVTKMLLLMECKCLCPYTGECIPYHALFGGQVEVEHIIPTSLMVDNEFGNLTLCYSKVNGEKLNNTPWQAFGPHKDPVRWAQIIERVKAFDNKSKMARFNLRSLEEVQAFANRRLNDTRYTSKLAGRLLMNLYADCDTPTSAPDDPLDEFRDRSGHQAIKVSSGTVTSLLRDAWRLYLGELIGDDAYKCPVKTPEQGGGKKRSSSSGRKDRCDHRHHAVDAVVIALTSDKVIHEINTLAGRLYNQLQRPLTYRDLRSVQSPWPNFIDNNFRTLFRNMIVSRRPEHKLSGALHEETIYGKVRGYENNKKESPIRHRRVAVGKGLTDAQIDKIVDGGIKSAIIKFRDEGGFSKWSEKKPEWPTMLKSRSGNPVKIKKVRIEITPKKLNTLGKGRSERYVKPGEVSYTSFFTLQTKSGTRWISDIVTLFDATQLVRALPKHDRSHEKISRRHREFPDAVFRFSLMKGDLVRLVEDGQEKIFVVRSFESDRRLWIAPINAAGKQQDMEQTRALRRWGFADFLKMGPGDDKIPQPVFVDLLGQPHNITVNA